MAQQAFNTKCRFTATSGGTGNFVVSAAVLGHLTPAQAAAADGTSYHYYAQNADGSVWEEGWGAYTAGSTTLARTLILANSLGTTAKINFAAPPTVDVFPSPTALETASVLGAPSGTALVFFQAAAPFGWTKQTTHNDKALRVVSGTGGGNGGSVAFSTVFGRTAVDSHAISTAELAAHTHTENQAGTRTFTGITPAFVQGVDAEVFNTTVNSGSAGSGTGHVHGMDIRVTYLDVIICTKD